MNTITVDSSIIKDFIDPDFQVESIKDIWKACPNLMLWEAIRAERSTVITRPEVLEYLQKEESVILIPEPLPAFCLGLPQTALQVSTQDLLRNGVSWVKDRYEFRTESPLNIEPLYILGKSKHWMIVLTTEGTASGQQLCALSKNQNE